MPSPNELLARLDHLIKKTPTTRMGRVLRTPVKSLWPVVARKVGYSKTIVCQTFFGTAFHGVLPEAVTTQVWRHSYYSTEVSRAILTVLREGDHFVDIGAHFGFFSQLAAEIVGPTGRTLSIEAMPETFRQLQKNMEIYQSDGRSQLFQNAAFNSQTTLQFKDFGLVASSLNTAFEKRGTLGRKSPDVSVDVVARPADDMISEARLSPRLIKIDAESAEKYVLGGLSRTIATSKPALILEMGDGPDPQSAASVEIWNILKASGYSAFSFRSGKMRPYAIKGHIEYENLLFLVESDSALASLGE